MAGNVTLLDKNDSSAQSDRLINEYALRQYDWLCHLPRFCELILSHCSPHYCTPGIASHSSPYHLESTIQHHDCR